MLVQKRQASPTKLPDVTVVTQRLLRTLFQNNMAWPSSRAHTQALMPLPLPLLLLLLLSTFHLVSAIKFNLPAYQYPPAKCIWNAAHTNSLVIVTANVGPGENQRVDVSILDSSENHNIYLSKKGINGETRLAITTHADGEVGVCFKNHIEGSKFTFPPTPPSSSLKAFVSKLLSLVGVPYAEHGKMNRVVDLDIDIGADAVDYK